jgi:DNA polymerase III epsilon subunit-like protein
MNVCVLDLETTGFDARRGEVVEYACVRLRRGEIDGHLASLCRPCGYIPRSATDVHGITMEMTAGYPPFAEHLPALIGYIGQDTVVCHNTPFDMSFIHNYCLRAGIDFNPPTGDTLKLARLLLPGLPSRKLSCVAEHLGITAAGYHRALADAMTTAQVYLKLTAMLAGGAHA